MTTNNPCAPEKPRTSEKAQKRKQARNTTKSLPGRPEKRTKADIILGLAQRPTGASIAQLTRATGWQAHSIRAALTGLRKRGHVIERFTGKGGQAFYRVGSQA